MNDKLKHLWEERSRIFKDDKRSVMEQSFPQVVNDYIEKIHLSNLQNIITSKTKICLDIGCGYGRIAEKIARSYPQVFIYGVDISSTFVKLYNEKLYKRGKAIVGDVRKLSFKNNYFDCVWVIVTLMYLEKKEDQGKAFKEIFRVLKKNGKVLIIEPNYLGVGIVKLGGIVPFIYRTILGKKKVETFGTSYKSYEIVREIKKNNGELIYIKGSPLFTLFLLPTIFLGKINRFLASIILRFIYLFDKFFSYPYTSYFIAYVAKKK